ncbi:hypothetical protein GYA19_01570 [Candidatus Beckwithbacteria bacterium]|nr:hypothetical protein [Candidatus Beckwithbacteria bacterium]
MENSKNYMINYKIIILLFTLIFLTACSKENQSEQVQTNPSIEQQKVNFEDIKKAESLIAFTNKNQIFLVDPNFKYPVAIYTFNNKEVPIDQNIENFYISPSHKFLAWYSPEQGIIVFDIETQQVKNVYKASQFLNTNPFLDFSANENNLRFITDDGSKMRIINLDTEEQKVITIPYPYGNVFKVSPDEKTILFISGYGQSQNKPQFMFTNINAGNPIQFESETNLSSRYLVVWDPFSQGVVLPVENKLVFYPLQNPSNPQIIFETTNTKVNFTSLKRIDNLLFALSSEGYWHVYDFEKAKEVARTPIEIANDLTNPYFIPWKKDQYLIEETKQDDLIQFKRLWISDFKGQKEIIIPRYNEMIINTKLNQLE